MNDNLFLEMAELDMDGTEALDEAGGLGSWLKRAYTGMDESLLDQLRDEIDSKVTTEAQRRKTLAEIDKFLAQAKGLTGGQAVYHLFVTGPFFAAWGFAAVLRYMNKNDGSREDYIQAMKSLRAEVAAKKL